jgi:mono/diheme cytochrome c family protein
MPLQYKNGLLAFAIVLSCSARADEVDFAREVLPILSNHCFECHGPDDQTREAGLRLDERENALEDLGGYSAIVPGHPDESELVTRIIASDEDTCMPPKDFEKPLSDDQIKLLTEWIEQGATFTKHWSFQPIRRPAVPAVRYPQWASNEIDQFVMAKLDAHELTPSSLADRYTLIRRVYLDLLGLLPSIAEVDEFVHDDSPRAYERLLDRALAKPHFGERWGRHWLDQARYADSHGYTNDNARSMWPYRDWVIGALNRDLPFDRFTVEQLAGDLLDQPDLAQRVATGFHRNTLINSEGGTKADQFRDEQVKDRVDTTGLVWMGLTVGCAKCHTHKFDPITQREYYQLYSFFNSTVDNNSVTPTVPVPSDDQQASLQEFASRKRRLAAQIADDPDRAARQAIWEAELHSRTIASNDNGSIDPDAGWSVLELSGKSTKGTKLKSQPDRSLLASGTPMRNDQYEATARTPLTKVRSVRLEVLTDEALPEQGPGRAGNGNFVLSEFWFRTGDGRELRFSRADAEHSQPDYEVAKAIDGKGGTGWAINSAPEGSLNRDRTAWFVLPDPLDVELDHALVFKMQFNHGQPEYSIGKFRLSISADEWQNSYDNAKLVQLVSVPAAERSKDQQRKIDEAFVAQDPRLAPIKAELDRVSKVYESFKRTIPTSMVLQELDQPRKAHVQVRGDFLRTSDEVEAEVPAVLTPLGASDGRPTRLDLADWIMSPEHPMTARVRVNRIWMRLFGRGLVETENDFGIQGTLPTHPELLDWLAADFRDRDWSTKRLVRLIMQSATYRQSSRQRSELEKTDRRNELVARQTRLRVEAEIVRDIALDVSGQLTRTIGGPSVYPPQEEGIYAFTQVKKNWTVSAGADRYRRGMYTYFYRSAPYPMLTTFDVPRFNATCTCRDRSNTPLQSLALANSDAMFETARQLGERVLREVDAGEADERVDRERIERAFRICFARIPTEHEVSVLSQYLGQARTRFATEPEAWTALARVLINLDEFITRE